MCYIELFRDTPIVDALEWLGLVSLPHNFVPQPQSSSSSLGQPKCDNFSENEVGDEYTPTERVNDPYHVDWNGPDDPENPVNWPHWKQILVVSQVMVLSAVTYMGAAIYTPGQVEVQKEFHVGHVAATVNLSVYIVGYGIGPMLLSPITESAKYGRLYTYIITLFLFGVLQVGAATVKNFGGLIVLRFLAGLVSSPAMSTGGGTMGDFIDPKVLPLYIGLWSVCSVAAPSVAPLLGAAMVDAKGWLWIFWFLAMLTAATWLFLLFFFPETYGDKILQKRAARIRKLTGDNRYYANKERVETSLGKKKFFIETFWRPFSLIISEPGILAYDLYIALSYGLFYLFFEAFPLVFSGIYHFTLVEVGLAFLGFLVGMVMGYGWLVVFLTKTVMPSFAAGTFYPELYLILGKIAAPVMPLSMLLFGWTAQVHWILPILWEVLFIQACFGVFQSGFAFLTMNYPRYLASVYAGNALIRSSFAAAFPLFGQAMFNRLATPKYPVAWGCTLLGFISLFMGLIPFTLARMGDRLRGRSKYAN